MKVKADVPVEQMSRQEVRAEWTKAVAGEMDRCEQICEILRKYNRSGVRRGRCSGSWIIGPKCNTIF